MAKVTSGEDALDIPKHILSRAIDNMNAAELKAFQKNLNQMLGQMNLMQMRLEKMRAKVFAAYEKNPLP